MTGIDFKEEDFYPTMAALERRDEWAHIMSFVRDVQYFSCPHKEIDTLPSEVRVKREILEDMLGKYNKKYGHPFHTSEYVKDCHGNWKPNIQCTTP